MNVEETSGTPWWVSREAEEKERREGLWISLQRVIDRRPISELIMTGEQMEARGQVDDRRWHDIWSREGYSDRQCRLLRDAFAGIEDAWIVFWDSGDPDRALWRLVDACGLLAEVFPEERAEATGRGYRIEKVPPLCKKQHRWNNSRLPQPAGAPVAQSSKPAKAPKPPRSADPKRRNAVPPRPIQLDPRRAFTPLQKAEIFLRSNGHCCACGIELGEKWHADHILPHAWGGLTEVRNGQAMCPTCNQRKHAKILTVDEEG